MMESSRSNAKSSPTVDNTDLVSVSVDSLLLGREIQFPIYDRSGVLLLAEGSVITASFRQKLREWDIARVALHSEDADRLSMSHVLNQVQPQSRRAAPTNDATEAKLKKIIADGLQFVTNAGPAVRDSVIFHGKAAYNPEQKLDLLQQSRKHCRDLEQLMDRAQTTADIEGSLIYETVQQLLKNLQDDFDCTNANILELSSSGRLVHHCYRMAAVGMGIAIEMGLNQENVCRTGVTGLLHDWGMLRVPEEIRNAERPLSRVEELELQKHVIHSIEILGQMHDLPTLVPLISYQIHEKMNGTGYPRQRSRNNIHLFARILHVAHQFVELTSETNTREALSPYDATVKLLNLVKAGELDALAVRALLRAHSLFPVGSLVMLSNGQLARVLRANGDRFTDPVVVILQDSQGKQQNESSDKEILNLLDTSCKIVQALPIIHDAEPIAAPHFLKKNAAVQKLQKSSH